MLLRQNSFRVRCNTTRIRRVHGFNPGIGHFQYVPSGLYNSTVCGANVYKRQTVSGRNLLCSNQGGIGARRDYRVIFWVRMLKNGILKELLYLKLILLALKCILITFIFYLKEIKCPEKVNFIIQTLKQNFTHGQQEILGRAARGPRVTCFSGLI
jgi:hypothetical protein